MRSILFTIGLIAAAVPAAAEHPAAVQPAQSAAGAQPDTLVHRFTIAPRQTWGTVSVALAPQAWRAGTADGPPATEAQLRRVLGRLGSVEIGARCASWVDGSATYPCGFAVEALDLAGAMTMRHPVIVSDLEPPTEAARAAADKVSPALRAAGLIAPVLAAPRFVAVRAPAAYLGDKSAAFGATLQFRFRAVSNPMVPSEFDRSSGMVILRGGTADDGV